MIGALIGGGVELVTQAISNGGFNNINWTRVVTASAAGAVFSFGSVRLASMGKVGWKALPGLMKLGALTGGGQYLANSIFDPCTKFKLESLVSNVFTGGLGGLLGGALPSIQKPVPRVLFSTTDYLRGPIVPKYINESLVLSKMTSTDVVQWVLGSATPNIAEAINNSDP